MEGRRLGREGMVPLKQSLPSSPETSAKQIFVWVDTVFHQEAEANTS